jgi:hypothetical protein
METKTSSALMGQQAFPMGEPDVAGYDGKTGGAWVTENGD